MLAAMRERSFSVVTATTKTEPVHIAIFGLLVLGDPLTPLMGLAILVATAGVTLMSFKSGLSELSRAGLRPILKTRGAAQVWPRARSCTARSR